MCLGLWIASGFGGRLRTEPYQSRHYAIMEWYLGRLYAAAVGTLGLRVEVHEPEIDRRRSRRPGWPGRSSCSAAMPGRATRCCSCIICSPSTTGGRGWS